MSELVLLTLIAPPGYEELLIDWLLQYEHPGGFSSFPISSHSSNPESLTLIEQVTGRKQRVRFEVQIPALDLDIWLDRLKKDFTGSAIHYWVTPVIAAGRL